MKYIYEGIEYDEYDMLQEFINTDKISSKEVTIYKAFDGADLGTDEFHSPEDIIDNLIERPGVHNVKKLEED